MVARGVAANAEDVAADDPVRLSFVEAMPTRTGGGGGGGAEAEVTLDEPPAEPAPEPVETSEPPRPERERGERESRELVEPVPDTDTAEAIDEPPDPSDAVTADTGHTTSSGDGSSSGTGGGTGGGTGSGDGSGAGSGTGPGSGAGAGGGTNDAPVYFRAGMERPRLLAGQHPRYTRQAQLAGVEGSVVVRILIGRDGRVRDVHVLTSIPLLDDEVVHTINRWRYTPPVVEGRPVAMYMIQRIRFDGTRH
jgi:protein TonB